MYRKDIETGYTGGEMVGWDGRHVFLGSTMMSYTVFTCPIVFSYCLSTETHMGWVVGGWEGEFP